MANPLEELIRQNNDFHDSLIEQNNELDRAFQSRTFGQLVQSWSEQHDRGDHTIEDVAGEISSDVLGSEDRGASGESKASESTI